MAENERPNIFDPEWQRSVDEGHFGMRGQQLGRPAGANEIGATLYEVDPGKRNLPYHAHHGIEETIVVIQGTPTIRTPDGETELTEGDVHCFGKGSGSAHQVINNTDTPVRFMMLSSQSSADFAEYPDGSKIAVFSGVWGTDDAFQKMLSSENEVGYFDGELG